MVRSHNEVGPQLEQMPSYREHNAENQKKKHKSQVDENLYSMYKQCQELVLDRNLWKVDMEQV